MQILNSNQYHFIQVLLWKKSWNRHLEQCKHLIHLPNIKEVLEWRAFLDMECFLQFWRRKWQARNCSTWPFHKVQFTSNGSKYVRCCNKDITARQNFLHGFFIGIKWIVRLTYYSSINHCLLWTKSKFLKRIVKWSVFMNSACNHA